MSTSGFSWHSKGGPLRGGLSLCNLDPSSVALTALPSAGTPQINNKEIMIFKAFENAALKGGV